MTISLFLKTPVRLEILGDISDAQVAELKSFLTYKDSKVGYELKKHKKAIWFLNKHGREAWQERLDELKAEETKCLLFEDGDGTIWTYSGLEAKVRRVLKIPDTEVTERGYTYEVNDFGIPYEHRPPFEPYPYQLQAEENLFANRHAAVSIGCHRRGERVLMYDGSFRNVEDVQVGEQLMGPDSKPRTVQELKRGRDTMFEVETNNGQRMVVNGNHILALRRTRRDKSEKNPNRIVTVTVNEYLNKNKKFKHMHKLFTAPVEFEDKEVPLDPYFLGLILGDGSVLSQPNITSMDPEIVEAIHLMAEQLGLDVRKSFKSNNRASTYHLSDPEANAGRANRLTQILRDLGVWGCEGVNKSIPLNYLSNSRAKRLAILAGLLDTDGSLNKDGCCFDFISKSIRLADDVAYLSRSLGMRARVLPCRKADQNGTWGDYVRVTISGDTSVIPTRIARKKAQPRRQIKNPTSFGFTVNKVSDDEDFYGFVLDSDHLYLTDTFLVTHNTGLGKSLIILRLCQRLNLKTLIMAPSKDIAQRLFEDLKRAFGEKYVGFFGDGKKVTKRLLTVGIAASLTRVAEDSPEWKQLSQAQVFISDESHLCAAATLAKVCFGVVATAPYRFFFSATQFRNDGLDMLLEGITGPVVYNKTVKEGIDEGYLSALEFYLVKLQSPSENEAGDPNEMTREHLYYNPTVLKAAGDLASNFVAHGLKVLVLVEELEQFTLLLPHLRAPRVAFAHGGVSADNADKVPQAYHKSDPTALIKNFNDEQLDVLVGTSCITTGSDIKANEVTIYLQGGKSDIQIWQGPCGRSTRLFTFKDGKKKNSCRVIDFDVTNCEVTHRHALHRRSVYENCGQVKEIHL